MIRDRNIKSRVRRVLGESVRSRRRMSEEAFLDLMGNKKDKEMKKILFEIDRKPFYSGTSGDLHFGDNELGAFVNFKGSIFFHTPSSIVEFMWSEKRQLWLWQNSEKRQDL